MRKFEGMVKTKKKRANKYDEKLAINGSFEDVTKLSAEPYTPAPKPIKSKKKK